MPSSNDQSRFTSQNKTTQERLSSTTVGLVALSDFRKRRAQVLEQQEWEARDAASATATPLDRSATGTPDQSTNASDASNNGGAVQFKKKKRKMGNKAKLSFGGEDEDSGGSGSDAVPASGNEGATREKKAKFKANTSVSIVPRAMTKATLRREAAERDMLRKEFLARQEIVKATEIAVPFVFYDGTNIPGGVVRVKKGDFIWIFLDKSRKVGADLGVGEKANARREWARVGVDDLMMVRGNIIVPHHYDFLFFIMNKTMGPNDSLLFDYSADAPPPTNTDTAEDPQDDPISTAASRAVKALPNINTLEGATDDPAFTKVVDRRWYERNKHIYPASTWQEFDAEKDYRKEIRRDLGGNTFFYT